MMLLAGGVEAADAGSPLTNSVADLSLEDLVNVRVTSVSKKEEKLNDAAAAIFVLSNDDLRRSGATTVADALRLVPGVQVAAIDSADWAVSARGFNSQFANKLLLAAGVIGASAFAGCWQWQWDGSLQHRFPSPKNRRLPSIRSKLPF